MAEQFDPPRITITHTRRRKRIYATGPAAVRFLDAIANGAPSAEAAAFGAWIEGTCQIPDEVKWKVKT